MKTKFRRITIGLAAATTVVLAGCGNSGPDTTEEVGYLSLGISDGPVHSALNVCIEFNSVELKQSGEPDSIVIDTVDSDGNPEKIDLLQFQGANAMPVVLNHELPAGRYEWMRLGVNAVQGTNGGLGHTGGADGTVCDGEASYIVWNSESWANLYVPSGENNGLKLVSGYTVPVNDTVSLTAEFDLGKSITEPPGQGPDVLLRPTIKLVNNNEVGTLTGQVANTFAEAENCAPSVYVFENSLTPNPINDSDDDPVATALVEAQDQSDGLVQWHYTVGFLLVGEYEVAFTCNDGENFEPEDGYPATIVAGEIETVDFPAPQPQ